MDLNEVVNDCLKAAEIGSEIISSYYHSEYNYSFKTNEKTSAVTEADIKTQDAVVDYLTGKYPEMGLLAEENGLDENTSRFEKDLHWQIDPIDGTLGFLKRTDNFGISISLVSRKGIPLVGVIYNPVRGLLARAFKGGGAFINDLPVKLSHKKDLNELRIIVSSNLLGKYPERIQALTDRFNSPEILSSESTVQKALHVITGNADVFISPHYSSVHPWDLSAIACISAECGGKLTQLDGKAINYNPAKGEEFCRSGYMFCNETIHRQIIHRLME